MERFIGVDMGGAHVGVAVVDTGTGELHGLKEIPTQSRDGYPAVIDRMADLIEDVIAHSGVPRGEIGGVGIGVPGRVDFAQGVVQFVPNLYGHWQDVPLGRLMEARLRLPVFLLNDVRAMTLAEWTFGAGQGVDTIACIAIGTGIGGGFVIDGRLHLGIGGTAGEVGHQIVEVDGPRCGCGSRGCLETLASGPAITAMGLDAVARGLATTIGELVSYDLNRINPEVISRAALEGDAISREIYERAGTYLGVAVANLLLSVGPPRVVIGGGVAQAGDLLLEPLRRAVRERVFLLPVDQVEIVPARLGTQAGIIGDALWARQCLKR